MCLPENHATSHVICVLGSEFQVKSYNCKEEFLVFRVSSIWAWMPVCEGTMQGQASFLSFSLLHEGAAAAAEGTQENLTRISNL